MNRMEAYLDNSATTPVSEGVLEIIEKTMREDYGNPSSRHQKGVDAEMYLRQAKERIASTLRVTPAETPYQRPRLDYLPRVETDRRLVEDKHLRVAHESRGDADSLTVAL